MSAAPAAAAAAGPASEHGHFHFDHGRLHVDVDHGHLHVDAGDYHLDLDLHFDFAGWFASAGHWLVLAVSASWVCVAQLARATERSTERIQHQSAVPLMTATNTSAWIVLCVPFVVRRWQELAEGGEASVARSFQTDAFSPSQPPKFLALAMITNVCYICALHFLPASLNTAIFCINPVFTLLFSALFLPKELVGGSKKPTSQAVALALRARGMAVLASVVGVLLIMEPWQMFFVHESPSHVDASSRLIGIALSLMAALGTSTYQVAFKRSFGGRLRADEVGLFLASMGAIALVALGGGVALLVALGVYQLDLSLVPWGYVAATASVSASFNLLLTFGISVAGPLAMGLATQIGIPMNLVLDMVFTHEHISMFQALGTMLMLMSYSLQQQKPLPRKSTGGSQVFKTPLLGR